MSLTDVRVLDASTAATVPVTALTDDQRWAAWQAKGRADDRVSRKRALIALPILLILAVAIALALGRL